MTSKTTNMFSLEVREPALRMVLERNSQHPLRWATILLIEAKIGCTGQTLNEWVNRRSANWPQAWAYDGDSSRA